MNIPIKATCFFILCSVCYESFSHDNVTSADFAELEETVRNNTGDIEELKRQIAALKEQLISSQDKVVLVILFLNRESMMKLVKNL